MGVVGVEADGCRGDYYVRRLQLMASRNTCSGEQMLETQFLVLPVQYLKMGWFVCIFSSPRYPGRGPIDHLSRGMFWWP